MPLTQTFNQWKHSFQMKTVLPLAKLLEMIGYRSSDTGYRSSQVDFLVVKYEF